MMYVISFYLGKECRIKGHLCNKLRGLPRGCAAKLRAPTRIICSVPRITSLWLSSTTILNNIGLLSKRELIRVACHASSTQRTIESPWSLPGDLLLCVSNSEHGKTTNIALYSALSTILSPQLKTKAPEIPNH